MSSTDIPPQSADYYTILGVAKTANVTEIRKAYRTLAMKWHPDKNPQNAKEAEEQFKRIGEAFSVLNDEQKRALYDEELLQSARRQEERPNRQSHYNGQAGASMFGIDPFFHHSRLFTNPFGIDEAINLFSTFMKFHETAFVAPTFFPPMTMFPPMMAPFGALNPFFDTDFISPMPFGMGPAFSHNPFSLVGPSFGNSVTRQMSVDRHGRQVVEVITTEVQPDGSSITETRKSIREHDGTVTENVYNDRTLPQPSISDRNRLLQNQQHQRSNIHPVRPIRQHSITDLTGETEDDADELIDITSERNAPSQSRARNISRSATNRPRTSSPSAPPEYSSQPQPFVQQSSRYSDAHIRRHHHSSDRLSRNSSLSLSIPNHAAFGSNSRPISPHRSPKFDRQQARLREHARMEAEFAREREIHRHNRVQQMRASTASPINFSSRVNNSVPSGSVLDDPNYGLPATNFIPSMHDGFSNGQSSTFFIQNPQYPPPIPLGQHQPNSFHPQYPANPYAFR